MILIRIRTGLMAILLIALAVAAGCGRRSSVVLEKPLRNVVKTESNSQTLMAWADAGAKADVLIHIDGTGRISLRFFHFRAYQKQQLARGTRLRCASTPGGRSSTH